MFIQLKNLDKLDKFVGNFVDKKTALNHLLLGQFFTEIGVKSRITHNPFSDKTKMFTFDTGITYYPLSNISQFKHQLEFVLPKIASDVLVFTENDDTVLGWLYFAEIKKSGTLTTEVNLAKQFFKEKPNRTLITTKENLREVSTMF